MLEKAHQLDSPDAGSAAAKFVMGPYAISTVKAKAWAHCRNWWVLCIILDEERGMRAAQA